MQKYTILTVCFGILLGALASFIVGANIFFIGLMGCILLALFILAIVTHTTHKIIYSVLACFLLGVCLGGVRVLMIKESERYELKSYYQKKVVIEGRVAEYPDVRSEYTYLTLDGIVIEGKSSNERVLVRAPLYPEYHYGDEIRVSGTLQKPKNNFGTSTQQHFSYSGYLSIQNIFSVVTFPKIEKVSDGQISFIRFLYEFKDTCIAIVTHYISEPAAGLLVGILFGVKRALSEEVLQDFITTGLVHIVVLSGYNIALVVGASTKLFKRMPLYIKYFCMYGSIALFVLFVGASSTVMRAGLMAAIALFARQSGRDTDGLRLLLVAAAAMVLFEPRIILYDPSFQLSFLATLGLIVWTPHTERWCRKIPKTFLLREVTATTIATQLTVVPYILWYMGSVSVIGLFTNIIIVPIVPLIMLLGFLTLVLGLVYLPLSFPFAAATYIVISGVIYVSRVFASIPGAVVHANMPILVLLILYALQIFYLLNVFEAEKR